MFTLRWEQMKEEKKAKNINSNNKSGESVHAAVHFNQAKIQHTHTHNHVQLFIYQITILDTINSCDTFAIESKIVHEDKLFE